MSQISVLKRITTKDQQNCEKFNQIILKKDINQIFIGRDIDCNYRISSIEISRKHALLEYSVIDNNWSITDLNSTNGLFINSIQLEANRPQRLLDGDRVSFGPPNQSQFCYQFNDNISENNSSNCVSYELSAINLRTIPVIPIVTRIQTTATTNSPLSLSSSVHFDIDSNQSRTISLTTTMPTRSGLSYSTSASRVSHLGSLGGPSKKGISRKTSVDNREQPMASFIEHDYSRSSSNRSVDKNNKNKRITSLKLKDNSDSKSKASKVTEIERKLIAKEKEKLEKSKKSLEQQKTMDRLKFKRREEELRKKQKELERKEKVAKKREAEIESLRKELLKEKKRLADKVNKESEESVKTSAKRKLRSSSTRESVDTKRQCSEDSKNIIEDIFESELTCSVCSEYFIQAVNLNCSHTFCQSCIEEWKHSKTGPHACPICRVKISNQNRELILDNLIDNFVAKMKPHLKEHRIKLAEERKKRLEKKVSQNQNTARMSTSSRGRLSRLIPSLHFFLRQTNVSDSESDTDDVNVIGFDFANNLMSSGSSLSSASSDSDLESDSDDSSVDSSSSDDDSVASSHNSGRSSVATRASNSSPEFSEYSSAAVHTSNDSDSSDSDAESVASMPSNPIEIQIDSVDITDDSDDSDFTVLSEGE